MTATVPDPAFAAIVARLAAARRVVVSSHERPDGDAVGSSLALALALRARGIEAQVVMPAAPPRDLQPFPGVDGITIAAEVADRFDAAVIMECSSLDRTGRRADSIDLRSSTSITIPATPATAW